MIVYVKHRPSRDFCAVLYKAEFNVFIPGLFKDAVSTDYRRMVKWSMKDTWVARGRKRFLLHWRYCPKYA